MGTDVDGADEGGEMRSDPTSGPATLRRQRRLVIAAVLAIIALLAGLVAWVWYPTTLQPDVTLTNTPFVGTRCAPLLLGGYGNVYNTTITLQNTGRAEGDVSVGFLLGNFSLGYRYYTVPQGSRVTDNASIVGEVVSSPTGCGPLGGEGEPAVALASVSRIPALDPRQMIYATVYPVGTLGFAGAFLGGLSLLARRRGISILNIQGPDALAVGFIAVFAASWFGALAANALMIPYNYPVDWTPMFVFAPVYGLISVAGLLVAWRIVLRSRTRNESPAEKERGRR